VGDVLRLPASARDSRAGANAPRTGGQAAPRTGSQAQTRTHTVAAGETLFGIARRYGVTVDAIRTANDLETDQVRTGQRLVIPAAR
jgi:LysM repeat protein